MASGPAGPRRRLGAELRRLRNGAGLHLDDVARELRFSTSKISRLETGKGVPKGTDVRALMQLYGVAADGEREMLMRLVQESRTEGWWEPYTEGVAPERFFLDPHARYIALETEAAVAHSFDPVVFPGLLQSPRYTRAVMSAMLPHHSALEIEQLVDLRGRRQEALIREPPLKLQAVVDEAVLFRRVGGPGVMADQLRAVLEASRLPSVSVQVLPFEAGLRRVHSGQFVILEFPDELTPDVVFSEGGTDDAYLDNPSDVDRYKDLLADAAGHALDPDASRALIERHLDR